MPPSPPVMTFPDAPARIMGELQRVSADLLDALQGIDDQAMLESGVAGEWRVKDILVHIARWDAIASAEITAARAGQASDTDYSHYLTLNDEWAVTDWDLPVAAARRRFDAAHHSLLTLFAALRENEWSRTARRWAKHAVWLHYPEHTAQVRAWRARRLDVSLDAT